MTTATTASPTPTSTPPANTTPTSPAPTSTTPTSTTPTSTPPTSTTPRLLAALVASALFAAGCGGADSSTEAAAPAPPPPASDVDVESTPTEADLVDDEPLTPNEVPVEPEHAPARVARVADHLEDLVVRDAPGSDTVLHTLATVTGFDSPTVLLVHELQGDWLEVGLPVRPNGSTGWIHADDVEVSEVELHVKVDLDTRELTVLDSGEEVLTTTVAIGDADHPTPTGTFSITDKLDTGDPDGPYGPFALGLSARSDVLTEFAGGDGQVGIHGTNVPSSIGEAASHGCIRVDNDVIEQLAALLPLGTPVTVS